MSGSVVERDAGRRPQALGLRFQAGILRRRSIAFLRRRFSGGAGVADGQKWRDSPSGDTLGDDIGDGAWWGFARDSGSVQVGTFPRSLSGVPNEFCQRVVAAVCRSAKHFNPASFYCTGSNPVPDSASMTVGERLKLLRRELKLSQEAMGAQGFVSTPGWIKIEHGHRLPSDELLHKLTGWLVKDDYIRPDAAGTLLEELLTLKYLQSASAFVRRLAYHHAKQLLAGTATLVSEEPATYRPRLRPDRPAGGKKGRPRNERHTG